MGTRFSPYGYNNFAVRGYLPPRQLHSNFPEFPYIPPHLQPDLGLPDKTSPLGLSPPRKTDRLGPAGSPHPKRLPPGSGASGKTPPVGQPHTPRLKGPSTNLGPSDQSTPSSPIRARNLSSPFGKKISSSSIDKRTTTNNPLYKRTTWRPTGALLSFYKTMTTSRPLYYSPVVRAPDHYISSNWHHWKPPDNKPTPPPPDVSAGSNLENFIWLVLGGFAVLMVIAFFMKLGKPIGRARRQLSNVHPAQSVATISLRPDRDDRGDNADSDMGSCTPLTGAAPSLLLADLPPPYSECVRSSIIEPVSEDLPPPYSAFSVT